MSRMHGHLPPSSPAMLRLDRAAQVLHARSAKAVFPAAGGGLRNAGSCSSASTGAEFDGSGLGGPTAAPEGQAGPITGKLGLTNVPLFVPSAPKTRRRRPGYKPYSVHAPRYKPPVPRKSHNSNALRKQLMGKGKRY